MVSERKYLTRNSWTKELMIDAIQQGNKGVKSVSDTSSYMNAICAYRGDDENKCAVGVFLPDDILTQEVNAFSIGKLVERYPGTVDYLPLSIWGMIILQALHDKCIKTDPRPTLIEWINNNVA